MARKNKIEYIESIDPEEITYVKICMVGMSKISLMKLCKMNRSNISTMLKPYINQCIKDNTENLNIQHRLTQFPTPPILDE